MRVFVLTGAGISAESGLRTFRDSGGLWEGHEVEAVATPKGFADDPALVQRFYDMRRQDAARAMPNAAHLALARLQVRVAAGGGSLYLCTQNVDDLHERAGSTSVVHMHGALNRARCLACSVVSEWLVDMGTGSPCPACGAVALRPDIVWFGEMPQHMVEIGEALGAANLFVSIGTSGSVYPAAGFVQAAKAQGAITVEVNLVTSGSDLFDYEFRGPATEAVPRWIADVFG